MALNGHFSYIFTTANSPFYIFTVESIYLRDQRRYADVRKRTVIRRIFGIFCRRYIFETLTITNKANITIYFVFSIT